MSSIMFISRLIDPKNDFVFKKVFGTEQNKDILIHFLNDILGCKGKNQITEVTFLKTIQDPEIAAYKQSIVDVLCKDQNGTQVIVEMQVAKHKGFEKRAQFYASKAYSGQTIKEDENHKGLAVYAQLKGVIFLAIADFIMFPDKKAWKTTHHILDIETHQQDLKDFQFVFVELPKFKTGLKQLKTIQEKWAYFFKHAQESSLVDIEHLIGEDMIIKRAFEAIDQAAWTEEEKRTYDSIVKRDMDNLAVEEQKLEDAEMRGEAIGVEKTARNLLSMGIDKDSIAKATGLSLEKIEQLGNLSHRQEEI